MSMHNEERSVTCHIVEKIGILGTHDTGWTKELNLVSWNGAAPKYDIRDWNPTHDRMGRGATLLESEIDQIVRLMNQRRGGQKTQGANVRVTMAESAAEAPVSAAAPAQAAETSSDRSPVSEEDPVVLGCRDEPAVQTDEQDSTENS